MARTKFQDILETYSYLISEASRIVPDFTLSVYSASCKYLFLVLIFALLLNLSLYHGIPQGRMGCQAKDGKSKEERIRPKQEKIK